MVRARSIWLRKPSRMNSVLFYPNFYPSAEWLRLAALCWDRVHSLRPGNERPPEDVGQLNEGLGGVLSPVDVHDFSGDPEVTDNFAAWISKEARRLSSKQAISFSRIIMLDGLFSSSEDRQRFSEVLHKHNVCTEKQLSVGRLPRWEFEPRLAFPESVYADNDRPLREAYWEAIAIGDRSRADGMIKADRKHRTANWRTRLVEGQRESGEYAEDVVFIPPEIPFHYLALCAAKAASQLGADLASASDSYTATCLYSTKQLVGLVSSELLKTYMPKDIASIDPGLLRGLRDELSMSRLKYQKDVQALVDEFAKLFSEQDLQRAKNRILEAANNRLEETKKAYARSRLDGAIKTFSVAVAPPVAVASLASALNVGLFMPAAIGATLSLLIAQRLLESEKEKADRRGAAFSYVFDVNSGLKRRFSWLRKLKI